MLNFLQQDTVTNTFDFFGLSKYPYEIVVYIARHIPRMSVGE